MKSTKKIALIIISSAFVLTIAGCSRTLTGSTKADGALSSFNKIVAAYPQNKGFHRTLQHWGFKLSGSSKFEWTKDTSANKIDYAMVIEADNLIKAGLNPEKLDQKDLIFKKAVVEDGVSQGNRIVHPYNVSDKKEFSSGSDDAFRRLLKQDTSLVKYNKDKNEYTLTLGKGYEVQWPETLAADKNIKFLIPVEPLIKAGLDVNKLEGTGFKIEKINKNDELIQTFIIK